jgi:serine/threonine protein kinase
MPWGGYLSEGAFKKVYRVLNVPPKSKSPSSYREEAVSVMDVKQIMDIGAGSVVEQEIKVSLLVSSAVRKGECPNFVETYGVFGSDYPPPDSMWGCGEKKHPRGREPPRGSNGQYSREKLKSLSSKTPTVDTSRKGRHQFIRMELCTHGDIEEFIHAQPNEEMSDESLRPMAFQMALSLYVAQRNFNMRHYDVKLLNFLLKSMDTKDSAIMSSNKPVNVCYGINGQSYILSFPTTESRLWVKLSDFGTADVDANTIGKPIGLEQFTTLENAPIEQMLLGTGSSQVYAADTWCLGLSMLHLFTGHCPYEELLEDVKCPKEFLHALHFAWYANEEVYGVVLQAGDDGDGEMERTLADTLYRYLVLFGLPTDEMFERCAQWHDNAVWRVVMTYCRASDLPQSLKNEGSRLASDKVRRRTSEGFAQHQALWSIDCGE